MQQLSAEEDGSRWQLWVQQANQGEKIDSPFALPVPSSASLKWYHWLSAYKHAAERETEREKEEKKRLLLFL